MVHPHSGVDMAVALSGDTAADFMVVVDTIPGPT